MFCVNCGCEIKGNDRFCTQCGTPVQQAPVQQAPMRQPIQQPMQQAPAPSRMPAGPIIRRFKTEGVTFINYNMPIRDQYDNLIYQAKTVSESMFQCTFRAWYPDGREAFTVKTKTKKMMTMFFEMTDAFGRLITSIDQQFTSNVAYGYAMPEVGLYAQGDFINFNFGVFRNQQLVAEVKRDFTMIKDSYQAVIYDPSAEIPVLGVMMAIQLETAVSRNRRRRW